ncbi:unnamed protein product [Amaranthus hypochondriacus]
MRTKEPQKLAQKRNQYGAIFMANNSTREECFKREIFGFPYDHADFVMGVKTGMLLFLYDFEDKKLYGVFEAASDGAMNIIPNAYNSISHQKFPAQVCFSTLWHCDPLPEHAFRDAIKENYYAPFKFNFSLSRDQVRRLLSLFEKTMIKTPTFPIRERQDQRSSQMEKSVAVAHRGSPENSEFIKKSISELQELISQKQKSIQEMRNQIEESIQVKKDYLDACERMVVAHQDSLVISESMKESISELQDSDLGKEVPEIQDLTQESRPENLGSIDVSEHEQFAHHEDYIPLCSIEPDEFEDPLKESKLDLQESNSKKQVPETQDPIQESKSEKLDSRDASEHDQFPGHLEDYIPLPSIEPDEFEDPSNVFQWNAVPFTKVVDFLNPVAWSSGNHSSLGEDKKQTDNSTKHLEYSECSEVTSFSSDSTRTIIVCDNVIDDSTGIRSQGMYSDCSMNRSSTFQRLSGLGEVKAEEYSCHGGIKVDNSKEIMQGLDTRRKMWNRKRSSENVIKPRVSVFSRMRTSDGTPWKRIQKNCS